MKILVYGAGVIGSLLIHSLYKGKNDVTVLARGSWKELIDKKGLVIKHQGFLYTTVDKVKTIDKLEKDDYYDLILVAMPCNKVINILKTLGENISSNIVLVGNNINSAFCEEEINRWADYKKNIAFAFQYSGGFKMENYVVCMHKLGTKLLIGGANNKLSEDFEKLIKTAFKKTKYKVVLFHNMEAWFLSHIAHVIPEFYVCCAYNCHLEKSREKDAAMAVVATGEAHKLLKSLDYPIYPEGEEEVFGEDIANHTKRLHFLYGTVIGKYVIGKRCKQAVNEMMYIEECFNELRNKSDVKMLVWDELRERAKQQAIVQRNCKLALDAKLQVIGDVLK